MRVYLAGPMSGIDDFNRPAFAAAADKLRIEGHSVFNPAAANLERLPIARIMAHVLVQLCEVDAIALLPGWRGSEGARIEWLLAEYIGLEIMHL